MTTKMKGLLKGLRYISQIFDTNYKEQEMQIGYPTDVKHVAHIGWDGPSVNSPSWMNEYRSAPLSSIGTEGLVVLSPTRSASQDLNRNNGGIQDSPVRDLSDLPLPKPRRHASSPGTAPADSPTSESPSASTHSRRNKSTTEVVSVDSPTRDPSSSDGFKHTRRHHNSNSRHGGTESPVGDLPLIPKNSNRKKSKGSTRSSRTKAPASLSDAEAVVDKNAENLPAPKSIGAD